MKTVKIIYLIGTISFGIMCGLGHLAFELLGQKSNKIIQTMENLTVSMPGRETNMLLLDTGLSLVMGLMLLAYGVINLMIIVKNKKLVLPPKNVILINIIFSLLAFILVYKYLFSVPIIFTGIAFLSFLTSYILYSKRVIQTKNI